MPPTPEPRLRLNARLLRERVPNVTATARAAGLRPATVSNLLTGRTDVGRAEARTLHVLANLARCRIDDLLIEEPPAAGAEGYADLVAGWAAAVTGTRRVQGPRLEEPLPEADGIAFVQALPDATIPPGRTSPRRRRGGF